MLNKLHILALSSVAALTLGSFPVHAQQTNTQITNQSGAAVGTGNYVEQNSSSTSIQQQRQQWGRIRGSQGAGTQDSWQQIEQSAGAVGTGNEVRQVTNQVNVQQNLPSRTRPSLYRY